MSNKPHRFTGWKDAALRLWLSTRPLAVQQTAEVFPLGTKFNLHDTIYHLVGYTDDGGILVSETDPAVDYDRAIATRERICDCCALTLEQHVCE